MTDQQNNPAGKLLVKNAHGYQILNFDDIMYCESMGSYTMINLKNDRQILSSHILKDVENQLPKSNFYRVNRSNLVNLNYVKEYQSSPYKSVILQDRKEIKISVRKNAKFLTYLRKHFPLV